MCEVVYRVKWWWIFCSKTQDIIKELFFLSQPGISHFTHYVFGLVFPGPGNNYTSMLVAIIIVVIVTGLEVK